MDVAQEAKLGSMVKGGSTNKSIKMDAKTLMSSMKMSNDVSPLGSDEEEQYPFGKEQDDYENFLADNMDFSDEEQEEDGSLTIKNAAQYAAPPVPKKKPKGRQVTNDLRETSGWFDANINNGPKMDRWDNLKKHKKNLITNFRKNYT
jgi:hypothetical protein